MTFINNNNKLVVYSNVSDSLRLCLMDCIIVFAM